MTRFEARNRLGSLRQHVENSRRSYARLCSIFPTENEEDLGKRNNVAKGFKLDLEAIDECERALEALGDNDPQGRSQEWIKGYRAGERSEKDFPRSESWT